MDLIKYSLRRPISVMVLVFGIIVFAFITIRNMPIDIFPKLGVPTIYVAQPYGGLSPEQMEGYMTSVYEQHFIYITGVQSMESRSIQSMALIKLVFHEDTDMAEALGQVVAQVNRAGGKMPPGTTAPFVIRFDAGNVPVGQLVFSSEERSLSEIQDLAVTRIRPMFSRLPGVSSPPPTGGNQRSVVITVDPDKLKSLGLSTEDVVEAMATNNRLSPAGTVRIDDIEYLTKTNSIVEDIKELESIPLRKGAGANIYLRDVGIVQHGADIATGFAMVNGQRSVYIPVNKRTDASTWTVVQNLRRALPDMRAAVPEDIKVEYAFDQSSYVISSLRNIIYQALIASLLTGLIVIMFLGDFRSGLVVVITIPLSILSAVIFLFLAGQTLNIMTLVGLALSIGVLVDNATVTIENIHRHFEMGKSVPKAITDGAREIVIPMLLIVFSLLAVFAPSFFMSGVSRSMFVPLSMAVGFAMISSFILAQTLVPVISNRLLKYHIMQNLLEKKQKGSRFERFSDRYQGMLGKNLRNKALIVPVYLIVAFIAGTILFNTIGTEIFPRVDAGQLSLRILAPEGTRIEVTEERVKQILNKVDEIAGKGNVEISSGFVGTVPSAYPASTTNIWNSGPHVASVLIKVNQRRTKPTETLKEEIRAYMQEEHPDMKLSFEPADIVDRVMSMGANNPIELGVTGRNIIETEAYAKKNIDRAQKDRGPEGCSYPSTTELSHD